MEAVARRPEVGGIVFVQGTNSIEETAYFLNLTVHTNKPIVVTGAQRPFTALGSDGPLNLIDAMRVARLTQGPPQGSAGGRPTARSMPRGTSTKTNTYRLQTFRSRDLGILGYADSDRIVFYRAPIGATRSKRIRHFKRRATAARRHYLRLHRRAPDLAEAAVNAGAEGLVIAGSGAGSTGEMRKELAALAAKGMVIVRSSRSATAASSAMTTGRNPGWSRPTT